MKTNKTIFAIAFVAILFITTAYATNSNNTLAIVTTSPLPNGQVGAAYSTSIQASGGTGDYSWSVSSGSLPAGLHLDPGFACLVYPCPRQSGILGTPTTAGKYEFQITLNDGSSLVSKTFTLTINGPNGCTASSTNCVKISSLYPTSGPVGTQVTIVGTNFTPTDNTVNFGSGVIPNLESTPEICTRSLPGGCTRTITFKVPSELNPACTYSNPPCLSAFLLRTTPGPYNVSVTNSNGVSNSVTFTVTNVFTITTSSPLPNGKVGQSYSTNIKATGDSSSAYNWVVTAGSLPSGLSFGLCTTGNQGTCVNISGTTTLSGTYNFTVTATDGFNSSKFTSKEFTLTVYPVSTISAYIAVLSPNGGETWARGTTQTIKWQDNTPYPPINCPPNMACGVQLAQRLYDIKLIWYSSVPCTGTGCDYIPYHLYYTIAGGVTGASYNWPVGKTLDGSIVPDGASAILVCQTGTSTCDSSDSYFTIVNEATTTPTISSLSPSFGPAGTQVTIIGSGFIPYLAACGVVGPCPMSGNEINFNGQREFIVASSSDGKTIKFTLFNDQPNSGALPPGLYQLSVTNVNGISNNVTFTVTDGGTNSVQLVKLGEKFWLSQGSAAQVTDYQNMKVKLVDVILLGSCPPPFSDCRGGSIYNLEVSLPPRFETSGIMEPVITLHFSSLNVPQTVFGTTITMLAINGNSASFVVGGSSSIRNVRLGEKFDLKIDESVQVTDYNNMKIKFASEAAVLCVQGAVCHPIYEIEVSLPPTCNLEICTQAVPVTLDFNSINTPQYAFGASINMLATNDIDSATFIVQANNSPVCGNGICEAGEYCPPSSCNEHGCYACDAAWPCPQDCQVNATKCTPRPPCLDAIGSAEAPRCFIPEPANGWCPTVGGGSIEVIPNIKGLTAIQPDNSTKSFTVNSCILLPGDRPNIFCGVKEDDIGYGGLGGSIKGKSGCVIVLTYPPQTKCSDSLEGTEVQSSVGTSTLAREMDNINEVNLISNVEKPYYRINGIKKVRLLSIFPVDLDIKATIDANTGSQISFEKPWWSFLTW